MDDGRIFIKGKICDILDSEVAIPNNLVFSPDMVLSITVEVFKNKEILKELKLRAPCSQDTRKEILKHVGVLESRLMNILHMKEDVNHIEMLTFDESDMYGHGFFELLYLNKTPYALIALHALQMMAIPAGESSCERAISKARYLCGDHRTREREELRQARILLAIDAKMTNHY